MLSMARGSAVDDILEETESLPLPTRPRLSEDGGKEKDMAMGMRASSGTWGPSDIYHRSSHAIVKVLLSAQMMYT